MTRLVRFANNATSKLAANLSSVGLTISLTPGDGAKFPALSGGQFFKGTLIKSDGTKEVVKVTARSTDTLTIQRANEAVGGVQTSYAFSAGDKFELRLTAQGIGDELDRLDAAAFLDVVNKSANYTIVEADISKLIKTDTAAGNVTITLPQISTLTGSFEVQISKNTGDGNVVTIARAGSDTINGAVSYVLASQYQCVWLVADLATNTWTAITSANASNKIADQFIGSGTAGPFTLSGDPGSKNNTDVYVGGVYQNKSTYTLSGTSLTLGGTVSAGVIIECNWAQPLPVGTPSDGTVTTAKVADGAITTEKVADGAITLAKTIGIANSLLPVGSVIFHAANTAPTGFLKANGALVSRTTYAALFAAIGTTFGVGDGSTTFALPDLRGEFLRGWDDGRGVDSGRGFGTAQLDQMQRITGAMDVGGGNNGSRKLSGSASGAFTRQTGNATGYLDTNVGFTSTDYTTGHTFDSGNSPNARVSSTTAGETRSRNLAFLACIKF